MIVVAALIRLILGGPVFYAQRRVGFGGQMFVCYKFRTMVETPRRSWRSTCGPTRRQLPNGTRPAS